MQQLTLTKIANFIRKEYLLLILGSVILIAFGFYVFNQFKPNEKYPGVMWLGKIAPGKTTFEELKKTLGDPIEASVGASGTIYSYPTTNEKRPTKVEVNKNIVDLVQEPVIAKERGSLQDYIKKFGNPEKVLYGKFSYASPANFWGSKGLIVFGNPTSGLIIEIWHFPPMGLEEFLNKYPEFKTEPSNQDL